MESIQMTKCLVPPRGWQVLQAADGAERGRAAGAGRVRHAGVGRAVLHGVDALRRGRQVPDDGAQVPTARRRDRQGGRHLARPLEPQGTRQRQGQGARGARGRRPEGGQGRGANESSTRTRSTRFFSARDPSDNYYHYSATALLSPVEPSLI